MPTLIATDCLFPGSAWEHTASEALPRKAGGACKALRSQTEPGNEVLLAFARVMIKAMVPLTLNYANATASKVLFILSSENFAG